MVSTTRALNWCASFTGGDYIDQRTHSIRYVPQRITDLVDRLRRDISAEVRSYVPSAEDIHAETDGAVPAQSRVFATFSRPPSATNRLQTHTWPNQQ